MSGDMKYPYEDVKDFGLCGYRFICNLFGIISRGKDVKKLFYDALDDNICNEDKEKLISWLKNEWGAFSNHTIHGDSEEKEILSTHYNVFHCKNQNNLGGTELLKKYLEKWHRSPSEIILNHKETRDPNMAMGFAMTLALAFMSNKSDRNFYVGKLESQKILFLCLDYFGYQDVEFIPEKCFEETVNFGKLLFSAVYSTIMFLYPKRVDKREDNWNDGKNSIIQLIEDDIGSELYASFRHVAEAKFIASQIWKDNDPKSPYLDTSSAIPTLLPYIVPDIVGKDMIMSCEKGQPVRSLVEGKTGGGKTALARVISLACQSDVQKCEKYKDIADKLGIHEKRWPVVLNCKRLRKEDIADGLILCGLRQMRKEAVESGENINLEHYKECEPYLLAFCNHKILQETLVFIIDDYSKIPADCRNEFNELLDDLCNDHSLHIVIITDKLKPSKKLRLRRAFNEFSISDLYVGPDYVKAIVTEKRGEEIPLKEFDWFAKKYVNTPKRLLSYIQALVEDKSVYEIISSCIEEELDIRASYLDYRSEYPEFITSLVLWTLRRRKEDDKKDSRFIISEKLVNRFLNEAKKSDNHWREIWTNVDKEVILLEQSAGVDSFEFGTPIFLYRILSDYYFEVLKYKTNSQCYGQLTEEFSLLSGSEFAYVLLLLFNRLYEEDFKYIPEDNVEGFIKAIIGKIFELESINDLEYCKWSLANILVDEYANAFIYGGNTLRREKCWNMLKRAYIAIDTCMGIA